MASTPPSAPPSLTGVQKLFMAFTKLGAIPTVTALTVYLVYLLIEILYIAGWPFAKGVLLQDIPLWNQTACGVAVICGLIAYCWRIIAGVPKKSLAEGQEVFREILGSLDELKHLPAPTPTTIIIPPTEEEDDESEYAEPSAEEPEPDDIDEPEPEEPKPEVLPPLPPVRKKKPFNIETLGPEYHAYWLNAKIPPQNDAKVTQVVGKVLANKARYESVAAAINPAMDWRFVGILHFMESSCNFKRHLHNGDPLTGRTYRVPKNRPEAPPANGHTYTWEESAIDALTVGSHDMRGVTDWSVENMLFMMERYNGFGYRYKAILSAYLWSLSTVAMRGRYVADHKFDPNAVQTRCGCVVIMKGLGIT